ncbi:MAG: hypothetical protein QGG36_22445 [Pirellulaceae bacterium]|jgi:hypothetical protein|nr:hypothetical protein [Pirellulaceae bacterium]MDP7018575.1 hypothetical protein [Pirellulaceae bacterium]
MNKNLKELYASALARRDSAVQDGCQSDADFNNGMLLALREAWELMTGTDDLHTRATKAQGERVES